MIKKMMLSVALLSNALPACGQSYQGRIQARTFSSQTNAMSATPSLTFNCDTDGLGHSDLCIDMNIDVNQFGAVIKMNADVNPKIANKYPKIVLRYFIHYTAPAMMVIPMSNPRIPTFVVVDPNSNAFASDLRLDDHKVLVVRTSDDGGHNWSAPVIQKYL